MLLKNNFMMTIEMFPSGEKIYKINLEQPKLVARADIFLMIGDFFRSGFPQYTIDTFDKPNGWTEIQWIEDTVIRIEDVVHDADWNFI